VRTAEGVRSYLEGLDYPARPQDLIVVAQDNEAPPDFIGLLGLLPTAVEFYNPDEIVDQLERMEGLGWY
jgi:hypothetical protein